MSRIRIGAALLPTLFAVAAQSATAQTYSGPVASNAYIVVNGLDWAWASPCFAAGYGLGSCSSGFNIDGGGGGWSFATATEWAARPDPSLFLDVNGNYAGMDCASGWFDLEYVHCDYSDAVDGYLSSGPDEFGSQGYDPADETWLVRVDGANPNVVPEPATMTLMATGLVGLVGVGRRMRKR